MKNSKKGDDKGKKGRNRKNTYKDVFQRNFISFHKPNYTKKGQICQHGTI